MEIGKLAIAYRLIPFEDERELFRPKLAYLFRKLNAPFPEFAQNQLASAAIGAGLRFLSEGNPPIAGEDFMQRDLLPRQRETPSHTVNWSPRHRGLDSLPESGGFEKDKRGGQSHRPKQDRFDYQDRFNQNRFHFVGAF